MAGSTGGIDHAQHDVPLHNVCRLFDIDPSFPEVVPQGVAVCISANGNSPLRAAADKTVLHSVVFVRRRR